MERWKPVAPATSEEPGRAIANLQAEVNRLFESVFGRAASPAFADRSWMPVCDIWETPDEVMVGLEVPGVSEKDVSVTITGDVLTVKGERRYPDSTEQATWHRAERAHGPFERIFALPMPVRADRVKATYRDGILTIHLPKADELKPKQVKIDTL